MTEVSEKWDRRFLELARHISAWSFDPSTKTGAVITRSKRIVSVGFNGFPAGVADLPERYADRQAKLARVIHCEVNAILIAERTLQGCTLYTWPFASCSRCAGIVIQAGIKRCVAPKPSPQLLERWGDDLRIAAEMFHEAGVRLDLYDMETKP